jgi:hypothetical protein
MEIMKPLTLVSCRKYIVLSGIVAAIWPVCGADVVLQKAPPFTVEQVPFYPENLARYHFGADVEAAPQSSSAAKLQLSMNGEDRNTSEAALLCDDPTTGYQLPAGASSILVSLANIENISAISFVNYGAQGDLAIATSNAAVASNSPEWRRTGKNTMREGAMAAKLGPGEAKYVKLTFDITRPGRIAAFGVYATPTLADFTMPRPRKISFEDNSANLALINFNFTDLHAKARGLYASSGNLKQLNDLIDDQPTTAYEFAPADPAPTAIIDLGRERTLSRLSAAYASQPGSVEFYVLRNLPLGEPAEASQSDVQKISNSPQTADLPSSFAISEKDFAGLKPVGAVVSTNEGRAAIDFPETTGRYVMLKWHPVAMQGKPFSIAQVAAFGVSKHGSSSERGEVKKRTGGEEEAVDGKQLVEGKNILDNKEIPAEGPEAAAPAEGPPPGLPPVPPFTFIPQPPPGAPPEVPPTSP